MNEFYDLADFVNLELKKMKLHNPADTRIQDDLIKRPHDFQQRTLKHAQKTT